MSRYAKCRCLILIALAAGAASSPPAPADDDADKSANAPASADFTLSNDQRHALGIVTGHPVAARIPERLDAFGLVLDASALVADLGELTALEASESAVKAEAARLRNLYVNGAGASPKMIEAAQVEETRASAQSQIARVRMHQHWGPVAAMAPAERQRLLAAIGLGELLLLRADLPGRHTLGALPTAAEVDVDGVQAAGRVLGLMRQTDDAQSVGVMIALAGPPMGLGAGARVPVALITAVRSGLLVPRDAVLYDEHGAYVFEQRIDKTSAALAHFARHDVVLLMPHGGGILVTGLDADDDIVVEGAGAVWSLEGSAGRRMADSDDDD